MKNIVVLCFLTIALNACVSNKTFNSMKAVAMRTEGELSAANTRIEELSGRNTKLVEQTQMLISDTTRNGSEYRYLNSKYHKLLSDGSAEAARMLRQIEQSQSALGERERKVAELQQMLKAREEAIAAIRKKVANALLGFDGKGLSISTRDGKVYVSMDDKLLFRSGSFEIDPNGAMAVKDLSHVLAQNPDINVMVEGHTDDVPYKSNGPLKDNLDLSAKRATTVVRLLLENKGIAPSRIIASGRGESLPLSTEKTATARQQNRRTEIILTPKMDELMQLMETTK